MARKLINMEGEKFGRWTVGKQVENDRRCNTRWLCSCFCGEVRPVRADDLRSGKSKSCGCNSDFRLRNLGLQIIHGDSKSTEYKRWCDMKKRCLMQRMVIMIITENGGLQFALDG